MCIIALNNGGSKAPIRLSGRGWSCLAKMLNLDVWARYGAEGSTTCLLGSTTCNWKHVHGYLWYVSPWSPFFSLYILTSGFNVVFPITYCFCLDTHLSGCVTVFIIVVVAVVFLFCYCNRYFYLRYHCYNRYCYFHCACHILL